MSLKESAAYLASSAYIRNLAALVICYGMSINIVEVGPTYVAAGCAILLHSVGHAMLLVSALSHSTDTDQTNCGHIRLPHIYIANPLLCIHICTYNM